MEIQNDFLFFVFQIMPAPAMTYKKLRRQLDDLGYYQVCLQFFFCEINISSRVYFFSLQFIATSSRGFSPC